MSRLGGPPDSRRTPRYGDCSTAWTDLIMHRALEAAHQECEWKRAATLLVSWHGSQRLGRNQDQVPRTSSPRTENAVATKVAVDISGLLMEAATRSNRFARPFSPRPQCSVSKFAVSRFIGRRSLPSAAAAPFRPATPTTDSPRHDNTRDQVGSPESVAFCRGSVLVYNADPSPEIP